MTDSLTARQTQILKILIDEYIETAAPIGSEVLEKKHEHDLGISSATIRAEMVNLTRLNFLKQPHTSAGRIPTSKAMKFYINQLMEDKKMSIADEVRAKEEVWGVRSNVDRLMEEATHALANQTKNLAVAAVDEDNDECRVWHAGLAHIFDNPEFNDLETCANVFGLLEEVNRIHELFFERNDEPSTIEVFFGDELGWRGLGPISVVSARMNIRGRNAALAVVGPARLSPTFIQPLRFFESLILEVGR